MPDDQTTTDVDDFIAGLRPVHDERATPRADTTHKLLEELRDAGDAGATLTELIGRIAACYSGLPVKSSLTKASANRLLEDLVAHGQIEQTIENRFRLLPHNGPDRADAGSIGIATDGSTPHTGDPAPAAGQVTGPGPGDKPGWPRWARIAVDHLDAGARRVVRLINADPAGAARLVGSAIGAAAIGLLVLILVSGLIGWAVNGDPLRDLAGILPARELTTGPLMRWFTTHTAGTGISAETAAWTWGITGLVVWLFACCNQFGAQLVAWPAYGVATIAMAWFGTSTATHRPVAAGLVAIAWAVLSLFALNRRPLPHRPLPHQPLSRWPGSVTNRPANEVPAKAGFEPCFVRDGIADGDTIAITHEINAAAPTQMVVTSLHRSAGGLIVQWIGVLPNGRKVHCDYTTQTPMWRQVRETLEAGR